MTFERSAQAADLVAEVIGAGAAVMVFALVRSRMTSRPARAR